MENEDHSSRNQKHIGEIEDRQSTNVDEVDDTASGESISNIGDGSTNDETGGEWGADSALPRDPSDTGRN